MYRRSNTLIRNNKISDTHIQAMLQISNHDGILCDLQIILLNAYIDINSGFHKSINYVNIYVYYPKYQNKLINQYEFLSYNIFSIFHFTHIFYATIFLLNRAIFTLVCVYKTLSFVSQKYHLMIVNFFAFEVLFATFKRSLDKEKCLGIRY